MKRWPIALVFTLLAATSFAQQPVPEIRFDADAEFLKLPADLYLGEASGIAVNSKGHVFIFNRGNTTGPAYAATASQLLEFDKDGKFIREIGRNLYAWSYAHTVRVDKDDNIWTVDKGSDMVVKFTPAGRVSMVFGRKKEASDEAAAWTRVTPPRPHVDGNFRQPTDVTWDTQGNIFVSDGYNNSRVAKFDKNGNWAKAIGERGNAPDQFNTPHGITSDSAGLIYVADRGNRRIQVYNPDLQRQRIIEGMGAPWSACISPGATQHLFTGDGNGKIYKFDLDGKLLGWAQTSQNHGQNGCLVHELHCESDTVLYKGDCSTWQVEKITISQ